MASERMEWVEIIEPRTKEHMYANLTTGECVWDPPTGVPVKKTDNNQWWELFDQNTSRFYYYNATSQKTVWHRPHNCDIIPLAKLQTLKQNTEPACVEESSESSTTSRKNKESVGTQTPGRTVSRTHQHVFNKEGSDVGVNKAVRTGAVHKTGLTTTTETQTSPLSSPRANRRTHHHHHHHHHRQQQQAKLEQAAVKEQKEQVNTTTSSTQPLTQTQPQQTTPGRSADSGRPRRGSQGSWYSRTTRTQDTSDSSCVSLSRNSLESPNHHQPVISGMTLSTSTSTPQLKKKPLTDSSNHHQLQPPQSQHQIHQQPHIKEKPQTHSSSGVSVQRSASNASTHHLPTKQKSFDVDISVGGGYSLGHENRSSGGTGTTGRSPRPLIPSSLSNNQLSISRSHSFAQRQTPPISSSVEQTPTLPVASTLSLDQEEEDSMHEKYFVPGAHLTPGRRSIESTPQARRKHHHHHHRCPKLSPDYANLASSVPPPRHSRSSSSNSSTLAPTGRRRDPPNPNTNSRDIGISSSDNDEDDISSSVSYSPPVPQQIDNISTDSVLSKRGINHHQPTHGHMYNHQDERERDKGDRERDRDRDRDRDRTDRDRTNVTGICQQRSSNKLMTANSPIYSNQPATTSPSVFIHDTEMHSHLLPLQQYILEQAKLSGCYRFTDSLAEEADSLQSEEDDGPIIRSGVEYDSDEFADDEAMSNQDDSSSQEYLHDEPSYLDTVEQYHSTRLNYSQPIHVHDGRVSDYVVDSLESRMAASSGYNSNLTSLSTSHQHSARLNHISSIGSGSIGMVPSLPLETQHASLKRKKDPPVQAPVLYSPILERSERIMMGLGTSRCSSPSPPSTVFLHRPPSNPHSLPSSPSPLSASMQLDQLSRVVLNRDKKLPSESDIEKYAQDNLNIHKKGIFRKKFSVRDMLSWSKDPIRKPMLVHSDKALKKDATELFKLVQTYMSDRKAKVGMTLNSVALEICSFGYSKPALRDEIYIQICRQTTENPRRESLRRGWELLAICLSFFPPSPKFQAYLDGYMNRHRDPSFDFPEVGKWPIHVQVSHYASVACKRLERVGIGGKRPPRKPTLEEIDQSRLQIFRPSMFGSTLQEVMALQRERFPHCKLPWVQTTLSEEVLRLQGAQTEGIFRVSADVDEVTSLKMQLDRWERPTDCTDAHTPASLLKLWYRELYEPLIPDSLYNDCIQYHDNPDRVLSIVDSLPEINRLVLSYLIRFLQIFARPEVVQQTKMDASNLAMMMAPNCLRCTSQDPHVIFDNARKEMAFMRTLIQCLDTSFMDNIV
ncbi:myTH4 and RhoGAP_KIAA1688 domain-containing protein RhoGAP93B isoform X3 [Lycorma delicatula]|uniref:myTH4 and RhoGAP_KIAA1688 domain-containing protein RhoGAP93B isoform X2 n=1 Tax=Lycorma delicatula TaxID=130591 RepID=UPI003F51917C